MDTKHQFSRRRFVFIVICLLVGFVGALGGDVLVCQETECFHPNITNGMVDGKVMVTVPPTGEYGNYAQADEVESVGEYGNYDYSGGKVIVKYSLNTRIKITCSQGHVFNGTNLYSGTVTCINKTSAGRCDVMWSGDPSSICTPIVCNPIAPGPINSNLTKTCDDVTPVTNPVPVNHTACMKCIDGYRMTDALGNEIPSSIIQCGPTGQWDVPVKCTNSIACPNLTAPTYGHISSFDMYSLVEFSCNDNFLMVGSPTLICDRGNWTGLPPLCRYKFSCLTNTLTHGVITVSPDKLGQGPWVRNNINATYGCETGFTNLTNTNIICVRGGWRPEPRCVTDNVICTDFSAILHGSVDFTSIRMIPGAEAIITCDHGYAISGSANRTCMEYGLWSGTASSCHRISRCGKPPTVDNAFTPEDKDYMEGDFIRFRCKSGYSPSGYSMIKCHNENWTNRRFRCRPIQCGRPSNIPNAMVKETTGQGFGDQVTYGCLPGYKMTSGILTSRLCQPNRRWTTILMKCEVMFCPALPQIDHGTLQFNHGRSWRYKSVYQYSCDKDQGYEFSSPDSGDSVELRCGEDETWSRGIPRCEIMFCPALLQIDHGTLQFNHGRSWRYGSVYQYSCHHDQGYEFASPDSGDSVELKCGEDKTWSRGTPLCEIVKCPPLMLPEHGTKRKLNHGGNNEYGAQLAVSCDSGYKLRGKEPSEEVIRVCQSDRTWSGQVGYCEDRKIFRSRQEWATFLSDREYTCCPLRKQHWWSPSCTINSEITDACLRGWSWDRPTKDAICWQEEVIEAGDVDHQIWYALLGVKVSKYGNRCCWVDDQNQPSYKCYESPPQSWL